MLPARVLPRTLVVAAVLAVLGAACGQYEDAGPRDASAPRGAAEADLGAGGPAGTNGDGGDGALAGSASGGAGGATSPGPAGSGSGGGSGGGTPQPLPTPTEQPLPPPLGGAACPGEPRTESASPPVAGGQVAAPHAVDLRTVTFSSTDGRQIEGLLGTPRTPGRYPGVVFVHGGFGMDPQADLVEKLARAGFVVLDPDYRDHAVGGREIDDAVAAARHLRTLPEVLPDRIGIMGGSHGGSITSSAVAVFPSEFQVAVSVAGASDWACIWQREQGNGIGTELERSMGGTPHEVPGEYASRSPVYQADRVTTPILVVHGLHDGQVPPGQSQNLVDALRAGGAPVTWRPTPTKGHNFLHEQPLEGPDWQEILRFLKAYLG